MKLYQIPRGTSAHFHPRTGYVATVIYPDSGHKQMDIYEIVGYDPEKLHNPEKFDKEYFQLLDWKSPDLPEVEVNHKWTIRRDKTTGEYLWRMVTFLNAWHPTKEYNFQDAIKLPPYYWKFPTVVTYCPSCKTKGGRAAGFNPAHVVRVNPDEYWSYKSGDPRLIHEILVSNTPEEREMLMTGICPDCFKEAIGPLE